MNRVDRAVSGTSDSSAISAMPQFTDDPGEVRSHGARGRDGDAGRQLHLRLVVEVGQDHGGSREVGADPPAEHADQGVGSAGSSCSSSNTRRRLGRGGAEELDLERCGAGLTWRRACALQSSGCGQ